MKKLIIYFSLLALFVALGLGSAITVMKFTIRGEEVVVPNLVEKDLVAALQLANKNELNIKVERTEPNRTVPKNSVISQEPAPGREVKRGRIIGVVVSQGIKELAMPNLLGQNLRYAEEFLKSKDLNPGEIIWVHKDNAPKGLVIAQSPPPSELVGRGSKTDLLISLGPKPKAYLMPDLTGQSVEEVMKLLKPYNIKINKIVQKPVVGTEQEMVVYQEPAVGTRLEEGQEVVLTAASYTPYVNQGSGGTFALLYYQVPSGMPPSQLVVTVQNKWGEREIFNDQKGGGEDIRLLVTVEGETVSRVYLNGKLVQQRSY